MQEVEFVTPKIKPLKRRWRVQFTELLKRFVKISNKEYLVKLWRSVEASHESLELTEDEQALQETKTLELAVSIFLEMAHVLEEDFCKFLCKVSNIKYEDLDEYPFDVETDILDQIVKQKSFTNFFSVGSRLYKMIRK
jgi:hypothetical protein